MLNATVPSVNQAYSMAILEESKRKLRVSDANNGPLIMMVGRNAIV